jgi:hypothetical protein
MFILLALACPAVIPPGASDDTAAAEPAITGGAEADALFDVAVLHELEVTIDPADWDVLRYQERTIYDLLGEECLTGPWGSPYDYFSAQVRFDGEDLGTVGVRKKGFFGSLSDTRPSLKIDVDHEVADARFHGLEKLVFNNGNQDPGRLRTCLAHQWFADAGLVAPRCALAHVVVNGEDLGVYAHTENLDEELVGRHLGARPVEMYEGALSDFNEELLITFEYETDTSDGTALEAIRNALAGDDEGLLDRLGAVLDIPAFITFWAAESIAGHWDGYNGNTNNFYLYTDPRSGLVQFMASGPDAAFDSRTPFGYGRPPWIVTSSELSARLWATEEGEALYLAEIERLLDDAWRGEDRVAQLDAWKTLVKPVDTPEMRTGMASTREVVVAKETDLRANIGGRFEVLPLRGNICWRPAGSVEVAFSTTWGSYPRGDLFGGGEAVTYYEIDGVVYPTAQDGVSAGYADDATALWLTISEIAPETWIAPYVTFDVALIADGAVLPIDGKSATAALLYMAPETAGQWQTAAYLAEGALTLEVAGTGGDAEWRGSLSTSVMAQGE